MDRVIFTGLVPLNEYRLDRPRDYAEQKKEGRLKKSLVFTELSPRFIKFVYAFGFFFLGIGIIIILLILYPCSSGIDNVTASRPKGRGQQWEINGTE